MPDSSRPADGPTERTYDGAPAVLMTTCVCTGREFNALRSRLPRAVRRQTPEARSDTIGVIVQAVTPGDCPLATRCAVTDADADTRQTVARLEAEVRRSLRQRP